MTIPQTGKAIDYLAENLRIKVIIIDNYPEGGGGAIVNVEFTNEGSTDITDKSWKIYMPNIR